MPSLWDGFEGLGESFKDWGGSQGNYGLGQLIPSFGDSMKGLDMVAYPKKDQSFMKRMGDPKSWANAEAAVHKMYGPTGYVPFATSIQLNNPAVHGMLKLLSGMSDIPLRGPQGQVLTRAMEDRLLQNFPYRPTRIADVAGGQNIANYPFPDVLKRLLGTPTASETELYLRMLQNLLPTKR